MGIDKYWQKPNNKKVLDSYQGEISKEDISSRFNAQFNIWDTDKSGKLESDEIKSIFNQTSDDINAQEFLNAIFNKVSNSHLENLAAKFRNISETHSSNKSMQEFQKLLDEEVDADNVIDLLNTYDNPDIRKTDNSLIDTIVSEKLLSGDKKSQKKVLLTILDKVCKAAEKQGVSDSDIQKTRDDFESSIKEEYDSLNSMFRMANPLKMERAIDFLRGAILVKQNSVRNIDSKDAMLTVAANFNEENGLAYKDFNTERSITANFGDWICGIFGCKTIEEMKSKLDMNVKGANELLTALVNEDEQAFKTAYKELFGIEFDPQKIAVAQSMSEKFATVQLLNSQLKVFKELKNSPDLEKDLKEKFKYSDEMISEIIQNYQAETKEESLKLFIEETYNNAKDLSIELSDGKTFEQLANDVELATKSAYGNNDITKEITQFNQNMIMTEAIADSALEIASTIALTMLPVIGQVGAVALAARTAKMGNNMVKVTNILRKTSANLYKANKFQQGTKYSSKAKNYGTRAAASVANTAVATAGVNAWSEKDIKTILQKTFMNSSFSWLGATTNTLAPILMQSFKISSQMATELAEEILNIVGSYGITKANGADYTQMDAVVDLVTGITFARLAGASGKNVNNKSHQKIQLLEDRLNSFQPNERAILEKIRKQYPELIDLLLLSKDKNGEFIHKDYALILNFINTVISNPELNNKLTSLLKMTNIDGSPRFQRGRIDFFLTQYLNQDPELYMKLAEMKLPNGSYRFNMEQLGELVNLKIENPELFDILINSKDSNGNYRLSTKICKRIDINYSCLEGYKANKERFLKLINAQDSQGNYLINLDEIIDFCSNKNMLEFLSKFSDEVIDKMSKEKGLFELFHNLQKGYWTDSYFLKEFYDNNAIVDFFNKNINKLSTQELKNECYKISAKFQYKLSLKFKHGDYAYLYFNDIDKFIENSPIDKINHGLQPKVDILQHIKKDIIETSLKEIDFTKKYIKDKKLLEIIDSLIEKTKNQTSNYTDKVNSLTEIQHIIDIHNTLTGLVLPFKNKDGSNPYFKDLLMFMDKNNPDIANLLRKGDLSTLAKDFNEEMRVTLLVEYCKNKSSSPEITDHLYNEIYVKNNESIKNVELKDKLIELNKKYGTKIFVSMENDDLEKVLEFVDEELARWQRVSGGKAKLPPTLDLLTSKQNYHRDNPVAGFCEALNSGAVSINGVDLEQVEYTLRHEITHTNDSNLLDDFPDDEGFANKTKYRDEFRKAGIPEEDIDYAYTDPAEFIAVASEGDLSQYSPEFKKVLIDFGMPKWLFDLDNVKTYKTQKTNYPDFIKSKQDYKFQEKDIDETVNAFIEHYTNSAKYIKKYIDDFGLSNLGNTKSRVKGYQSLHDKIKNFIKDKPIATYEDIWKEVRDCFGARTVIDSTNYKNHPDVKALLEKGNIDGAIKRAAELQSEPLVQEFKNIIDKNCSGDKRITTARISNYVSEDGIPYLSEAQLAEIKQYAIQKGVKINIVEKVSKDDPHYKEIMESGYKPTTKSQPSGYTALQINFKTSDGDVFEWQYRGNLVDNFAEGEHIPYDLRTGKDIIGDHEELRPLYEPLQKLLSEDNMPKNIYKQYNKYLTDYYTHLRKLELGFESSPPKLSNYSINGFNFDPRLEGNNLIELHNIAEKLKKGEITQKEAVEYKKLTQG